MRLRHVGIVVGDLKEAVEWYQRFNYFPLLFESVEVGGGMIELCKLAHKDGSMIELLDGATARPHISVTVNQLEFEMLKENNDAKLFEAPGVMYVEDPWDNIIEIVENRGY